MSRRVLKYVLDKGRTEVIDAKFLHFDSQNDNLVIWLEVVTGKKYGTVIYEVFPTGLVDIPESYEYVSSCKMYGDKLIWHLYKSNCE